jgi:hypothetical protein
VPPPAANRNLERAALNQVTQNNVTMNNVTQNKASGVAAPMSSKGSWLGLRIILMHPEF